MTPPADSARAALLLSNQLTRVDASPLKAREFWALIDRADALGITVAELATDPSRRDEVADATVTSDRLRTLLDATRAVAFELERLGESGIEVLSALDDRFPGVLRDRRAGRCPPQLFVAGDPTAFASPMLAIVGDHESSPESLEQAARAVAAAVVAGWTVVAPLRATTGSHDSTDDVVVAEAAACEAALVLACDLGINRAARASGLRRLVLDGRTTLVSPFAPDAVASAAAASARDSIVHALGTLTLVTACSDGTGSTWAAASEAVEREPASIVVVDDAAASAGTQALARLGAKRIESIDRLGEVMT